MLGLVYLAFESIAAMAWIDPPYDWARNFISDLGFSDCSSIKGYPICSPLHALMNAGFLVQGGTFAVGSVLVTGVLLRAGARRATVRVLLVASGSGTFLVGIFHQSLALYSAGLNWLHLTSAVLAIGAGNLGIILLGVLVLANPEWRWYGRAVILVGVVGGVGSFFLLLGADVGIGIGFVERVAIYPLNIWTVGTGTGFLVKSVADQRRRQRALG